MGKISKLMKLLSASAVVAGANSVALADCGLCGDKTYDHGTDTCPHFDYRGYGLSKGYKPETLPDNKFLGRLALADRKNADAFLDIGQASTPTSSMISFATPSGETAGSTDTGVATSYDNTRSNTETTTQSSNEKPGASDKLNTLKFERTQDLEDRETTVSESDANGMEAIAAEMKREEAAVRIQRARRAQLARREAAHQRDTQELKNMVADSLAKNRENEREVLELRAKDARLKRRENALKRELKQQEAKARDSERLKEMMAERVRKNREEERLQNQHKASTLAYDREAIEQGRSLLNLSGEDDANEVQARIQQNDGASEIRKNNEAANRIQRAAKARLARKKAARLKEEQVKREAAAKKITDALRANKERKQAERQAQIDGDYELAKKLQAEYDAEDRQIRADRLLAEQEQLRENLAAVPVEEARNGADFEYRSEQDQINADNLLAQQEQAREYLGMNTQEQSHVTATKEAVADEEVETDRWNLPQATAWNFQGFDFESNHRSADRWAKQLDALSVRKIECIMWLISTSYQQLQNAGNYAPTAQMAEALSDVNNIFPYSGTNSGIMNVYRAFENTDTADFVQNLERLGKSKLDGILWYVSNRYMHLLLPGNGKKAASAKFIELAKAVFEYFNTVWEAKDAQVFGEENETPGVDNTEPAVVNENRREPQVSATAGVQGIAETERAEDTEWDIPYVLHEVLNWPLGSYCGGDNRRVYLGKFNEALQDLGIRRLEVVMYLAASSYQFNKEQGHGALGEQALKLAKDIYNNVFSTAEIKPNARLANCHRALENMHDKPLYFGKLVHHGYYSFENNDMKTYEGSFQGAFRRITAGEQEVVLGNIATLYREKLREGKHPSSMLFVDFADEICKESSLDGFYYGEDTEEGHPAWDRVNNRPMWEFRKEFESDVQPAVVNPQNADQNTVIAEDPETNPWRMPEGVNRALMYAPNIDATEVTNEGEGFNVQAALQRLTVRQLEAVIGLGACAYTSRSGARNVHGKVETAISNKMLEKAGKLWSLILSAPKGDNERLLHVYNALRSASNAESLTEDLNFLPLRKVEGFLAMAFQVYNGKLRHGVVPADEAFVTMTDEVLELFGLNYDEEEAPAEDEIRHGALDDDNRSLVEPIGA